MSKRTRIVLRGAMLTISTRRCKSGHLFIFLLALILQLSPFCISSVSALKAEIHPSHKTINGSASTGHPHPQFFYPQTHPHHTSVEPDGRDPRQWLSSYGYGSPYLGLGMWGGPEIIITTLLVVLGLGVIGLPFIFLLFSAFSGQGVNFIPPTTTTTVAGRKRREAESIFPKINPQVQSKLLQILDNFYKASDKVEMFKKLLQN